MGIFGWLLGQEDEEQEPRHSPPSIAAKDVAGPDIDAGREKTQTEKDLRRVESLYDAESDSFKPEK
jgi:hypothetical protein